MLTVTSQNLPQTFKEATFSPDDVFFEKEVLKVCIIVFLSNGVFLYKNARSRLRHAACDVTLCKMTLLGEMMVAVSAHHKTQNSYTGTCLVVLFYNHQNISIIKQTRLSTGHDASMKSPYAQPLHIVTSTTNINVNRRLNTLAPRARRGVITLRIKMPRDTAADGDQSCNNSEDASMRKDTHKAVGVLKLCMATVASASPSAKLNVSMCLC